MGIDNPKVRQYAIELRQLLEHYAAIEPEAAMIYRELLPLIDAVIDGTAQLPYAGVPCGWYFIEGKVAEFDDLANAYSAFAFNAKGRDAEKLHRFFTRLDTDPKFVARMQSPNLTWREKIWSGWSRLMGRLR